MHFRHESFEKARKTEHFQALWIFWRAQKRQKHDPSFLTFKSRVSGDIWDIKGKLAGGETYISREDRDQAENMVFYHVSFGKARTTEHLRILQMILKRPEKPNIADPAGYFGEAQRDRTKHISYRS
jgi:hypothetical protein